MEDIPFDLILSLAAKVVSMGMNVKANKERCQRVAKRVKCLQELVLELRKKDPRQISDVVRNALKQLSATLVNARDMMQKYHQSNVVKKFIFSSSQEDKFNKVNEQFDDAFQILSGAMQIEQGEILNKVLYAVTGQKETRQLAPHPIGFCDMSPPSRLTNPTIPTSNVIIGSIQSPSPLSPVPTSPITNLFPPQKTLPNIVPAISVTKAPNPPYPPAQRPAYNPNLLTLPSVPVSVLCAMPPRVVTMPPPAATMQPIVTVQGTVYGTTSAMVANTVVQNVYAQTAPTQQVIVTASSSPQVLTNPGMVTYVVNRSY